MYPIARKIHPKTERVYVSVMSETDTAGFAHPRSLQWPDGRIYKIDEICSYQPAETVGTTVTSDCYTILIGGEMRQLFFEYVYKPPRVGRWFVEVISEQPQ